MLTAHKSIDCLAELITVAELIHEEAVPIETLNSPKTYEIPASYIGRLGNILKELNRHFTGKEK